MHKVGPQLNYEAKTVAKLSFSSPPSFDKQGGAFTALKHLQVIVLTFKNLPSDGQQQGNRSKQPIENFIHVDGAVVASTPGRGVNWQLFSSPDCNLNLNLHFFFSKCQNRETSSCRPPVPPSSACRRRVRGRCSRRDSAPCRFAPQLEEECVSES